MALTLTGQCNIPRPAWSGDVLHWLHDHRCHRSPRFLFTAPRHRGAAADQSRHPCALAKRAGTAGARPWLSHALSGAFPRRLGALHRLHAGGAGRAEMADRTADAGNIGRRIFTATAGCRCRPHPAGSCAGNVRRSRGAIARGMARIGAVGPGDGDYSQPARGLDAHRHHAVRSRPAVFAFADHAIAATNLVHADGVGRGFVHAAGQGRLVPALRNGVGARRRHAVAAVRRRSYRGSHQAGLSRDPGAPRTHAAYSCAGAGVGAVVNCGMMSSILVCRPRRTPGPITTGINCCRKASAPVPKRNGTAYGSSLSRGRLARERRTDLLIPWIEIVARRHRRGDALRARTVRPPPPPRETLAAFETAWAAINLRLRSGDERRQAIDADAVGDHRLGLWLRLKLRLRTMLAMAGVFAGRMLLARLVGLGVARAVVARHERLRLHRDEAGLLPEIRKAFALVVAVLRGHFIFGARLRLVLTELLLGGGDQAEIMFGVLIIILGS